MEFLFLNNALQHFSQTMQEVWAPIFQMHGIAMLLAVSTVAFGIYAINYGLTGDAPTLITGIFFTILSLSLLRTVFTFADQYGNDFLNGYISWAREVSGMSPEVMTPSGVMQSGLRLAAIFWRAGAKVSWWYATMSSIEISLCSAIVVCVFGAAAIMYLLAIIEVTAFIVAASVLLACAALPWTWSIFPGWALTVLSACIRLFFLLCVLALGLAESAAWARDMNAVSGSIADNVSIMLQVVIEATLFIAAITIIPRLIARMVVGATSTAMHAGEYALGSIAAGAAGSALGGISRAASGASKLASQGAEAGVSAGAAGAKQVALMLMR